MRKNPVSNRRSLSGSSNKMQITPTKPLVTIAVITFNQERFIANALLSCLRQTYQPLEIILSDDCSTDQTFHIASEIAATYVGPHRLILNRNYKNLSLGGQVNYVMNNASGELVIFNAGDDVSEINRVEILTNAWLDTGQPSGVASSACIIDADGKQMNHRQEHLYKLTNGKQLALPSVLLAEMINEKRYWPQGAVAGWSKKTWEMFGNLPDGFVYEDKLLAFRAALHAGIMVTPESLLQYRTHSQNLSFSQRQEFDSDTFKRNIFRQPDAIAFQAMRDCNLADIAKATSSGLLSSGEADALAKWVNERARKEITRQGWWSLKWWQKARRFRDSPIESVLGTAISVVGLNAYCFARTVKDKLTGNK